MRKVCLFWLLLCSIATAAQEFEYEGMLFRVLSDSTVKVSNHDYMRGRRDTSYHYNKEANIPKLIGDIVIPQKVRYLEKDFTVTEIGDSAFMHCFDMTSVSIPNTITKIGRYSFRSSCITHFQIPQSVKHIGNGAFYHADMTNIVLPDTMDYIGESAFYACRNLNSIKIPYGIKTIKRFCFYSSSISIIYIPETVTTIEQVGINSDIFIDFMLHDIQDGKVCIFCNCKIPPTCVDVVLYSPILKNWDKYPSGYRLYVPHESIALYEAAEQWNYLNIRSIESATEVDAVSANVPEVGRYDMMGHKITGSCKGVNVVRYADGTTKKVLVR